MANNQYSIDSSEVGEVGVDADDMRTNNPIPTCIPGVDYRTSSEPKTGVVEGHVDSSGHELHNSGEQRWWARTASSIFSHLVSRGRGNIPLMEDILFIVFRLVVEDEDPYNDDWARPFTTHNVLSLVCRSWRHAAVNSPPLWRFIVIDSAKVRSMEDLLTYRTLARRFLSRSRGRIHRFSILNVPCPSSALHDCDFVWFSMISEILSVSERFFLHIDVPENMSAPSHWAPSLHGIDAILSECEAPLLSMATLTVGSFAELPQIRYALHLPLFALAPQLEGLAISGIDLRPSLHAVGGNHALTSLEFCTGSYVNDILPLIVGHRLTLQRLALSNIPFDVAIPCPTSLPSLVVLELDGSGSFLLQLLDDTSLPKLTSLRIEFEEQWISDEYLLFFSEQHPEAPLAELILCRRDGEFSAFLPAITTLPHLRSLTIKGRIESKFFRELYMWTMDEFAKRLDILHIVYAERLDDISASFLAFLNEKYLKRPGGALELLTLEPIDASVRGMPLRYQAMYDACCIVEKCTIAGLPCTRVLNNMSNWVNDRFARVLMCTLILGVSSPFACFVGLRFIALGFYLPCSAVILREVLLPCCVSRSTRPFLEIWETAVDLRDIIRAAAHRVNSGHLFLDG